MRYLIKIATTLAALWFGVSAAMAAPQYIAAPDTYSADIIASLAQNGPGTAAKKIVETIGQPAQLESLEKAMQVLAGKHIDFSDKVVDNAYGKALREIVYYTYIEDVGFIYFRFNFKMTSHGWVLANFNFKEETNDMFPKDFVAPR